MAEVHRCCCGSTEYGVIDFFGRRVVLWGTERPAQRFEASNSKEAQNGR